MRGWQALGQAWNCVRGKRCLSQEPLRVGSRVWVEASGTVWCEACGKEREAALKAEATPDLHPRERADDDETKPARTCVMCPESIPKGKPMRQVTCSRSCAGRLRARNAAASRERDEPATDGAGAL